MSSSTPHTSCTENDPQLRAPPQQRGKASKPFDREDADLILRSGDEVDFHVHRLILTLASPMFADMLSVPQPPGADSDRPVVAVTEDSEVLDVLLRVCYPEPVPELSSLEVLHRVLSAATKYEIQAAIGIAKNAMVQPRFMDASPLHVFVGACRFGLEDEAVSAARCAVEMNRFEVVTCPGLDDISAGAYHRLLNLHRSAVTTRGPGKKGHCKECACRRASRSITTSVGWAAEARLCARSLLQDHDILSIYARYLPEFETIENGPYRRLLLYLEVCSQAATASFNLELEVPKRRCSESPACQARYPNKLQSRGALTFFATTNFPFSRIQSLKDALKNRPCGSTPGSNSKAAREFLAAIANDDPPCHRAHNSAPRGDITVMDPNLCSLMTNLGWAWAFLDSYAVAVDNAVSKVPGP